jgi:fructokinase
MYRQPGFKVDVVDTIGCGDAFLASWLAGMLAGNEPRQTLAEACAIGAKVAAAPGANPATA